MIRVIAVGKNNPALKGYEADFVERIKRFSKFEFLELKEDKSKDVKQIIQKEQVKILDKIRSGEKVILLDISGSSMDSIKFSDMLRDERDLTFIIGGAYGVGDGVRECAYKRISFSPMTFNHQLARIMLLEQVYRGFSIIKGRNYHK